MHIRINNKRWFIHRIECQYSWLKDFVLDRVGANGRTLVARKVQRADLTCDVIKKVAPFVLSKLWILVADWSMRWSRDTFLIKLQLYLCTQEIAGFCCQHIKWEADIWGWLEVRRSAIYFTTQWTSVCTKLADSVCLQDTSHSAKCYRQAAVGHWVSLWVCSAQRCVLPVSFFGGFTNMAVVQCHWNDAFSHLNGIHYLKSQS